LATIREQSVKDNRVISESHKKQFLLFTTDKEMRFVHALELLKTDIGVVATSSNNGPDAMTLWTNAFIKAKAKILRDFEKLERPYFCVLHRNGEIVRHEIKPRGRDAKSQSATA
jgi:hypothetical protein